MKHKIIIEDIDSVPDDAEVLEIMSHKYIDMCEKDKSGLYYQIGAMVTKRVMERFSGDIE
jgi:hypothetical protein